LEKRYLQLRNNKRTELLYDYLKVLYRINQPATYKSQDEYFIGTIQGVNAIGKLQLMVNNEVRTFDLKEIQYV
jgi:BirA family transcriptional regulator, biotin operon repressor / biotin---[acetyl-CoA-carboxylase] ligase